MKMIELRPGDFFCTTSVGVGAGIKARLLCSAIRKMERLHSKDGQAFYTHCGIITSAMGTTFEARWTYGHYHIDDYFDGPVLIGRWVNMTPAAFDRGWAKVLRYHGKSYPLWRLPMFLFPLLPKISLTRLPVCSELDCMFGLYAGIDEIGGWRSQMPSDVADMIKKWDAFDVVYEGAQWPGVPAN